MYVRMYICDYVYMMCVGVCGCVFVYACLYVLIHILPQCHVCPVYIFIFSRMDTFVHMHSYVSQPVAQFIIFTSSGRKTVKL